MPDLIAQGSEPRERWRRPLPSGEPFYIGRTADEWATPWDDRISRIHAEVTWKGDKLHVKKLPSARNPIFVRGRTQEEFSLRPGEHFVIGHTRFMITDERANVAFDSRPVTERTFSPQYLRKIRFRDADKRIDVLSRLPDLIAGAGSDQELFVRLVNVLLTGISRASAAAVVKAHPDAPKGSRAEVLHWDRRVVTGDEFRPSAKLITRAVQTDESTLHIWNDASPESTSGFTLSEGVDWAYCTPLSGSACQNWAIYVAGSFEGIASFENDTADPNNLRDELKFTEIAATTVSNIREMRLLERRDAALGQFFSPVVVHAFRGQDPEEVLAPREADVTVLFCDLRGFSRASEKSAGDLFGLLERVSRALGVATNHILDLGGVIGDFHGDATMGFWGWPMTQPDAVGRACTAAAALRREFEEVSTREAHILSDFRAGIGIAKGTAVAGKIGTEDQVKVTVFGPVVNLAARLESMTKLVQASILIDEATAAAASAAENPPRMRRVARVKPYGLDTPLWISELLVAADASGGLSDEHLARYDEALSAFMSGDWLAAERELSKLAAVDRTANFVLDVIRRHNGQPPEDWNGVIEMSQK